MLIPLAGGVLVSLFISLIPKDRFYQPRLGESSWRKFPLLSREKGKALRSDLRMCGVKESWGFLNTVRL